MTQEVRTYQLPLLVSKIEKLKAKTEETSTRKAIEKAIDYVLEAKR